MLEEPYLTNLNVKSSQHFQTAFADDDDKAIKKIKNDLLSEMISTDGNYRFTESSMNHYSDILSKDVAGISKRNKKDNIYNVQTKS